MPAPRRPPARESGSRGRLEIDLRSKDNSYYCSILDCVAILNYTNISDNNINDKTHIIIRLFAP